MQSLKLKLILTMMTLAVSAMALQAQVVIKRSGGGEIFDVADIATILQEDDGKVTVMAVLPERARPEQNKELNLKNGDVVLFLNGKRIRKLAEYKKAYEDLKPGDAAKMGIKRDGERFMVSFTKLDPDKLPERRMMVRTRTEGDESDAEEWTEQDGAERRMELRLESDVEIEPVLELGALFSGDSENNIKVHHLLPGDATPAGIELKAGDVLLAMNGKSPADLESFVKAFNAIKSGAKMQLKIQREGKEMTLKFAKPEKPDNVFIRMRK